MMYLFAFVSQRQCEGSEEKDRDREKKRENIHHLISTLKKVSSQRLEEHYFRKFSSFWEAAPEKTAAFLSGTGPSHGYPES